MRIAYCTWLIPHISNIFQKYPQFPFVVSVDHFIMNQIRGIRQKHDVSIINVPAVSPYPLFPKMFLKKIYWSYDAAFRGIDIPIINLRAIRQIVTGFQIRRYLGSWARGNPESKVILIYNFDPLLISTLIKIKKQYSDTKVVLVIGDLPDYRQGFLDGMRRVYYQWGIKQLQQFDGCIMVSPYMAELIGIETKRTLVIEGIYHETHEPQSFAHNERSKIIFYAGTLDRRFGVFHLLDAFSTIEDENYELWLAGGSSEADEIKKRCKADPRIRYMGFVPPEKVSELQAKSTVIVNPRTSKGEYTKYSFPSKTMDGLASGKPFIGYKLPGIPEEYYQYIQCVEREDTESLRNKIIELCELPKEKRDEIGKKAREFILREKNCTVQGAKIVAFLESL